MADLEFNKEIDPLSFDDLMEDLKREQLEEQKKLPPPWKTLPFWMSIASSVLFYTIAALPEDSSIVAYLAPIAGVLYYLGYQHVQKRIAAKKREFGKKPLKTKAFWFDIGSTGISYILGSGLAKTDFIMSIGLLGATLLAQFGIDTSAWIRRKRMVDPLELLGLNLKDIKDAKFLNETDSVVQFTILKNEKTEKVDILFDSRERGQKLITLVQTFLKEKEEKPS